MRLCLHLRQLFTAICLLAILPSCASFIQQPKNDKPVADVFGYQKWIAPNTEPDVVIIGIHGFCGASRDYANLGNYLLKHQPLTGLYAYEVRGQGNDPKTSRRGDVEDPKEWSRDLLAFTKLIRKQHPNAKILWFGESMGALIATHTCKSSPLRKAPCDGIILSSPVVRFRDDIPPWAPNIVLFIANTIPSARISLDAISRAQKLQMTQSSDHSSQTQKNSYHVDQHTLRLLGSLTRLINEMNQCAPKIQPPILILHGGNDFFNSDADMRGFLSRLPKRTEKTYHNYPKSYHLLMYDEHKDQIFQDVERWTQQFRTSEAKNNSQ